MDQKFSAGQAGVDALTSSLNSRMYAPLPGQGAAGAPAEGERRREGGGRDRADLAAVRRRAARRSPPAASAQPLAAARSAGTLQGMRWSGRWTYSTAW